MKHKIRSSIKRRIAKLSKSSIERNIKKAIPEFSKSKYAPAAIKQEKAIINVEMNHSNPHKLVIFDTNFLLIPEQFKIDIFDEARRSIDSKVEMMIFDKTIYELQKISSEASKAGISAKVALQLINKNKIAIIATSDTNYVDQMLLNYDHYLPNFNGEVIIATQDKQLKDLLKARGIRVLVMANKTRLAVI